MILDLIQIRQRLYGSSNWFVVPFVAATHDYSVKEQAEQQGNVTVCDFSVIIKKSDSYDCKKLTLPSIFELSFDGEQVLLGSDDIPVRATVVTENISELKISYKSIK